MILQTVPLGAGLRAAPETDAHRAAVTGFLRRAVLMTIFAQRFALPGGAALQLPLTQVLMIALTVEGLWRGILVVRTRLTLAYLGLAAYLFAVTLVHSLLGFGAHPTSVAYLLVLYVPMVCKLNVQRPRGYFTHMMRFYVQVMTWVSIVGLALFLAQFVGVPYRDWFALVVPPELIQQDYVTSYGLTYGSDIFRNNAVIFLEASFYSAFAAVAFLGALLLHERPWRLVLFAVCLFSSASGTGMVVIGVAIIVLLLQGSVAATARAVVPFAAVLVLGASTPVGAVLLGRLTEGSSSNSSTYFRMVLPYEMFLPKIVESGPLLLIGHGAGTIDDVVQIRDLIYPLVPKSLYDYGLFFTVAFLAFAAAALRSRYAWPPLTIGLVAIWVYVGAGLLATVQVGLMLVFAAWWPTTDPAVPSPDDRSDEPLQPSTPTRAGPP